MSDAPKFKTFRDLRALPKVEQATLTSTPSTASITSSSSTSSPASISRTPSITSTASINTSPTEVSPVRDFQKVPNSIPRNLDLFRGKSKQVWDYLWSVSRGAINPSRTIRKPRKEIKDSAKLGSMVTVDAAIESLVSVGLLKVIPNIGSLGGNEYEIFTPEEINASYTSTSSISSSTSLTQKVVDLDILESSITSITQPIENKTTYNDTKTSFKDNIKPDDDSDARNGFSVMNERLNAAVKKLTGKNVSNRDADGWGTLADLLILELEVAARKTDNISSVPAFLTEILRRQFFNSRQQKIQSTAKSSKTKFDTVGQSDTGSYEIKALDKAGRESALEQLREFAKDEFLQDFKKWYTAEDWDWLTKQLGEIKPAKTETQDLK